MFSSLIGRPQTIWPKERLQLTAHEKAALEAWYAEWTPNLQKKMGPAYRFNHEYVARLPLPTPKPDAGPRIKTLEIGGGNGDHLDFENLSRQDYYVIELREAFAKQVRGRLPDDHVITGDIEQGTSFADASFDRIIAIHVLEHLCNLPGALAEIKRLLAPGGVFDIALPCEAGLAYSMARAITTKRSFEKRFDVSYDRIIASDHVSTYAEIEVELFRDFEPVQTRFFPLLVPSPNLNIFVGMRLKAR
jgi:SAM-dependent methyltransferase